MKRSERGFALLLVFAMASIIAIAFYMQLPNSVFEAQRQKEQLLIERGEQYQRAIQLFVRKNKTYPPSLDALENTNNIRFLRRRYEDPMTGKKEWRIIHIAGGVFTDSLVHKQKQQTEQKSVNTFISEGPAFGAAAPQQAGAGSSVWMRARKNMITPGAPGSGGPEGQGEPPGQTENQPGQTESQPGQTGNQPGQMVAIPGAPPPPAGYTIPQPGPPAEQPALQPGTQTGPVPFGAPGMTAQSGYAGQGIGQQPGGSNQAINMIQGMLTRPRPGGLAGPGAATGGAGLGSGIAGVATTLEASGIKVYNERTNYNEWEFLYDQSKDRTGLRAATAGMQAPQQGAPIGTPGGSGSFRPLSAPNPGGGFAQPGIGQVPGFGGFGRGIGPGAATSAQGAPSRTGSTGATGSTGSTGSTGFGAGFGSGFGSGFGGSATTPATPSAPTAPPKNQPAQPQQPAGPQDRRR